MIVEVRVDRVWFGDPSPTQAWRGDVITYFVQPDLYGFGSGFHDEEGWYHHNRLRTATLNGRGSSDPMLAADEALGHS